MRSLPLPDPGTAPLTGPWALLGWLARRQAGVLTIALACGVAGFGIQAFQPYLIGRVVDSATAGGLDTQTWRWAGLVLALGIAMCAVSVLGHRLDVRNWMEGAFRSSQLVSRQVSRSGHAISAELPTGEVVASVANDVHRMGDLFAMSAQFVGSLVAYGVTTALMLRASVQLGIVIALGLPVVAVVLAFLVKPLSRRQAAQREAAGRLTTLGADTVSGLRILRGIGGESVFSARYRAQSQKVRAAGVRVAGTQSWLDALQVVLPGLFTVVVVYLGALAAVRGEITAGQLVSFFGFAAFLSWPVQLAVQFLKVVTNAHVSAGKVVKVLRVAPATGAAAPTAQPPAPGAILHDEATAVTLRPGRVVALVAADPDESAAVALRLGRFDDDAEATTPVTLGGVRLSSLPKEHLRRRIVVAHATPTIFSGRLDVELDSRSHAARADLDRAMHVADAHDVLDSVPGGLTGELPEKGRSLSGGQRQRVALARALLTDPEILVLVEPTSAVDAHTEARIAARLAHERRGRTTLIVTASPLVLDHVDEVLFLEGGRVVASGSHRDLLAHPPGAAAQHDDGEATARYRRVVGRALEDGDDGDDDDGDAVSGRSPLDAALNTAQEVRS